MAFKFSRALLAVGALAAAYAWSHHLPAMPTGDDVTAGLEAMIKPACQPADFRVDAFKVLRLDAPALQITGKLANHCAVAAGAKIKIAAEDARGNVVDTLHHWPASTNNIAPGEAKAINVIMPHRKEMKRFSVDVIEAYVWH